jgi:hypothetical protein
MYLGLRATAELSAASSTHEAAAKGRMVLPCNVGKTLFCF